MDPQTPTVTPLEALEFHIDTHRAIKHITRALRFERLARQACLEGDPQAVNTARAAANGHWYKAGIQPCPRP